jgi:A/G-specific adenine glycosylase
VVDGNVYRVLARHFGIDTPINTTEGKKLFATLAQELLPLTPSPSQYNQAIMDFGALQCTPQSPNCIACPFIETCQAFREGKVSELPVKLKTLKVTERHLIYIYVRCKGYVAIHRRSAGDIWQGLWEPLFIENGILNNEDWLRDNCQLLAKQVKHVLTHRVLYADFYLCEVETRPQLPDDYIWIKESELDDYAKPRLIEKLLTLILDN